MVVVAAVGEAGGGAGDGGAGIEWLDDILAGGDPPATPRSVKRAEIAAATVADGPLGLVDPPVWMRRFRDGWWLASLEARFVPAERERCRSLTRWGAHIFQRFHEAKTTVVKLLARYHEELTHTPRPTGVTYATRLRELALDHYRPGVSRHMPEHTFAFAHELYTLLAARSDGECATVEQVAEFVMGLYEGFFPIRLEDIPGAAAVGALPVCGRDALAGVAFDRQRRYSPTDIAGVWRECVEDAVGITRMGAVGLRAAAVRDPYPRGAPVSTASLAMPVGELAFTELYASWAALVVDNRHDAREAGALNYWVGRMMHRRLGLGSSPRAQYPRSMVDGHGYAPEATRPRQVHPPPAPPQSPPHLGLPSVHADASGAGAGAVPPRKPPPPRIHKHPPAWAKLFPKKQLAIMRAGDTVGGRHQRAGPVATSTSTSAPTLARPEAPGSLTVPAGNTGADTSRPKRLGGRRGVPQSGRRGKGGPRKGDLEPEGDGDERGAARSQPFTHGLIPEPPVTPLSPASPCSVVTASTHMEVSPMSSATPGAAMGTDALARERHMSPERDGIVVRLPAAMATREISGTTHATSVSCAATPPPPVAPDDAASVVTVTVTPPPGAPLPPRPPQAAGGHVVVEDAPAPEAVPVSVPTPPSGGAAPASTRMPAPRRSVFAGSARSPPPHVGEGGANLKDTVVSPVVVGSPVSASASASAVASAFITRGTEYGMRGRFTAPDASQYQEEGSLLSAAAPAPEPPPNRVTLAECEVRLRHMLHFENKKRHGPYLYASADVEAATFSVQRDLLEEAMLWAGITEDGLAATKQHGVYERTRATASAGAGAGGARARGAPRRRPAGGGADASSSSDDTMDDDISPRVLLSRMRADVERRRGIPRKRRSSTGSAVGKKRGSAAKRRSGSANSATRKRSSRRVSLWTEFQPETAVVAVLAAVAVAQEDVRDILCTSPRRLWGLSAEPDPTCTPLAAALAWGVSVDEVARRVDEARTAAAADAAHASALAVAACAQVLRKKAAASYSLQAVMAFRAKHKTALRRRSRESRDSRETASPAGSEMSGDGNSPSHQARQHAAAVIVVAAAVGAWAVREQEACEPPAAGLESNVVSDPIDGGAGLPPGMPVHAPGDEIVGLAELSAGAPGVESC